MLKSGQSLSGLIVTKDATGALATPSVGPAGTVYVNGVANAATVTVTGSNPYKWAVTLPTLTAGDTVSVYVTATISSVATAAVVFEDVADTKRVSDLNDAVAPDNAGITAIKAKTDNLPASPAAVGSAMTLTSAYDAAKTAATQASVNALPTAAGVRSEMDANSTKLANLDAAVTSRLAGATYSAPPSAASVADAVWDEATADHAATGTTGKALANAGSAADPLTNIVPGTYASGTAGAALGHIGSGQITTTSIVAQSGNVTTVAGDDYNATDGRAIDWTDSSASWPDLTGASILVTVKSGSTTLMAKAGSVVTPTGAGKQVRVQPTAADTRAIGVGTYDFDVQATLSSGHVVTLLRGQWTNQADYSA